MMSAKLVAAGLLKTKVFWNKGYDTWLLSVMSPTKFYHVTQIIFYMGSCDQSLVTLAFLWEKLPHDPE